MNDKKYRCFDCGWEGENVEYDQIDTCMGADETEMCPECGGVNVMPVFTIEPKL
jgi:DNA-directed RNA polymerase subunit RPC12/RpoP